MSSPSAAEWTPPICAALAVRDYGAENVAALHISYGQRTEAREQTSFLGICEALGIHRRLIVKTPFFRADRWLGAHRRQHRCSRAPQHIGADIPVTYVPFRNAHFLSAAVSWAEVLGADRIYIGAVQQDSSGYPDCRPEFYEAFNRTIVAGTREGRIQIETPLIALRKHEIVRRGLELGAPFHLTWSCYSREDQACGSCDSCVLRLRAFAAAGAVDPISYLSQTAVQDFS